MKKILFITSLACIFFANNIFAVEMDVYVYKVKPGSLEEALEIFQEGSSIASQTGMNVAIAQQSSGKGGELTYHWLEFYDSLEQRAEIRYADPKWDAYTEKFYSSNAIDTVRTYSMTSLDEDIGDENVALARVYVWDAKPNMYDETITALFQAKEIFEKHGFVVDLWQQGVGSKHYLEFVMLSSSEEEQAKSLRSVNADQDWIEIEPVWMKNEEVARFITSFELSKIN
ncbi:MAG TPA: hypothetical protein QGG06_01190 [Gammaproteobacteria bacterium]|jgi:hypothetical protein|nr:hypothetical protein [Gammaproteobacteria bacterium]HJP42106.1 hypothetical protein [Gammaproteobacteria bacterium]|tara:strand:- start:1263 stop:1946 length:684 start_codon:yes stop_codon:yes gene_type:complete